MTKRPNSERSDSPRESGRWLNKPVPSEDEGMRALMRFVFGAKGAPVRGIVAPADKTTRGN